MIAKNHLSEKMLLNFPFIFKRKYSPSIFERAELQSKKVGRPFFYSGVKYEHKHKMSVSSETTLIFENVTFHFNKYAENKYASKI